MLVSTQKKVYRYIISHAQKEKLAVFLTQIDPHYIPSPYFKEAYIQYQKHQNYQFISKFKPWIYISLFFLGSVYYMNVQRQQKIQQSIPLDPKDYKRLTQNMIKKKETYSEHLNRFDSMLNKLQQEIQQSYQKQLEEYREFINNKSDNKVSQKD